MECKNEHFRHILLFYFRKEKNAAQAAKTLRDVYGEEALKYRQCRNWFNKFRFGDFSLKDEQRSGRPNKVDDQIKAIIKSGRHVTLQEIQEMLKIPNSTIDRHIQRLGLSVMNYHKQHRKPNCIIKRLCCMFGGIGKVCYFLSCFQGTKRLIRTSTVVS